MKFLLLIVVVFQVLVAVSSQFCEICHNLSPNDPKFIMCAACLNPSVLSRGSIGPPNDGNLPPPGGRFQDFPGFGRRPPNGPFGLRPPPPPNGLFGRRPPPPPSGPFGLRPPPPPNELFGRRPSNHLSPNHLSPNHPLGRRPPPRPPSSLNDFDGLSALRPPFGPPPYDSPIPFGGHEPYRPY